MRAEASPSALLVRGAALRKQIKHTRLYDPAAPHDAPLCLLDLPWADVVAAAPAYIAALAAVRMPTHAAILLFSSSKRLRPFTLRHYERIFCLLAAVETSFYLFADAYIYCITGRVVIYALPDAALHALGTLWFHRSGPFRSRAARAAVLCRLIAISAVIVYSRAWALLLRPAYVVQLLAGGVALWLSGAREARMRQRYAAQASTY